MKKVFMKGKKKTMTCDKHLCGVKSVGSRGKLGRRIQIFDVFYDNQGFKRPPRKSLQEESSEFFQVQPPIYRGRARNGVSLDLSRSFCIGRVLMRTPPESRKLRFIQSPCSREKMMDCEQNWLIGKQPTEQTTRACR